jgi:hypothetical protein
MRRVCPVLALLVAGAWVTGGVQSDAAQQAGLAEVCGDRRQ